MFTHKRISPDCPFTVKNIKTIRDQRSFSILTPQFDSAMGCTPRRCLKIRISRRNRNWIRKYFTPIMRAQLGSNQEKIEAENLVTYSLEGSLKPLNSALIANLQWFNQLCIIMPNKDLKWAMWYSSSFSRFGGSGTRRCGWNQWKHGDLRVKRIKNNLKKKC